MTKRNPNFSRLQDLYLFPAIARRKQLYLEQHPQANIISLGIGDTTEPIPSPIIQGFIQQAAQLGTSAGYNGYGPEQGQKTLRDAVAVHYYQEVISPDEIFISDGAKCDIGRLQMLFGPDCTVAVQDPAYPVYVEGSLLQGVHKVLPLPCLPENNFFPDLNAAKEADLIYFCSPNNPTGAAATRSQLGELVAFAKQNRKILIYDAAYANFIQDSEIPKTIYDIPGAREVAIEVSSFSKIAGFTGVRLGWTIVPEELQYEDGQSVKKDWKRLISTIYNGASNIAQHGGIALFSPEAQAELRQLAQFYMGNAKILKEALKKVCRRVYSGDNAPFLWAHFPGQTSWDLFEYFIQKAELLTVPGSGFGPSGEGFLRISAFGHREQILAAAERIATLLT